MFKRRCTAIYFLIVGFAPMIVGSQNEDVVSTLEVYNLETDQRRVIYTEEGHFEAPNWSTDGEYFIINQAGLLFKIDRHKGTKQQIDSGQLNQCNNDHGISPNGKWLAISNNDPISSATSGSSRIYIIPVDGGHPKLLTPLYPSYWHGWSPDSNSLVYTAMRDGEYDIYRTSISDSTEERLTDAIGLDDGPDYSPDGHHIYYNSIRSGTMELWRMISDGSNAVQLTQDDYSNWFPHPSPNNRYLVFLSYLEDQGDRHPAMKNVALRLYDIKNKTIRTLCSFTGGQGTINVPSWSPDSKAFAFVSYQLTEKK